MTDSPYQEDQLSLSVHECSTKGGERILLNFPSTVPQELVYLIFCGSRQRHEVPTGRHSPTSLFALVPEHEKAEVVDLSVCHLDKHGEQVTLFKTQFAYVMDEKQYITQLLQSLSKPGTSPSSLFPPLPTADALREYDRSLTEALKSTELPSGWSLVSHNSERSITSVEDCIHRDTLLHFAAKHSLNHLAQYLLSLPGSSIAAMLPNEEGKLPIDLTMEQGNEGLTQLLTLFMNFRPNGVIDDSPIPSPKDSPKKENDVERDKGSMLEVAGGGLKGELGTKRNVEELQKFKEINHEWQVQVKHYKSTSGTPQVASSSSSATSTNTNNNHCSNCVHSNVPTMVNRPLNIDGRNRAPSPPPLSRQHCLYNRHSTYCRKRRSSIAVMTSIFESNPHLVLHPESVSLNVKDPLLATVDRQRKASWSFVVGISDSRSVGTGLNELDRITAEDLIHEKLVEMKTSSELEAQAQYNLLYRLSASCPMLCDEDLDDDEDSQGLPLVPQVITTEYSDQMTTSSTEELLSIDDSHSESAETSLSHQNRSDSNLPLHRTASEDANKVTPSFPLNAKTTHSLTASLEILNSRSGGEITSAKKIDENVDTEDQKERSCSTLDSVPTPDPALTQVISTSAPDLVVVSSEMDPLLFLHRGFIPVEDSLMEHRSLRQIVSASPVSDDQTETDTNINDMSNTSAEDGYVILSSPQSSTECGADKRSTGNNNTGMVSPVPATHQFIEHSTTGQAAITTGANNREVGEPLVDREKGVTSSTPTHNRLKSHRRSLSASDADAARKLAAEFMENCGNADTLSTASDNWNTFVPMANISETNCQVLDDVHHLKGMDLDDRSRASSMRTNETSSLHESEEDSSNDDDDGDFLSAKESVSQISLDYQLSNRSTTSINEKDHNEGIGGSAPAYQQSSSEVALRNASKRRLLKNTPVSNRYSADFLGTNIDEESDDEESPSPPNTFHRSRPHRRIHSTSAALSVPDENTELASSVNSESKTTPKEQQLHLSVPGENKSVSADSVFGHDPDPLTPSDIDISLESSFDHSQSSTTLFVKETNSPKSSTKKKFLRSPLLQRKATVSNDKESPTAKRKGGLKKEDVVPTMQKLRGLINMSDVPPAGQLSDDSDTTVSDHIPTRATSGLSSKTPGSNLERSVSSVSDPVVYGEETERNRSSSNSRSPLNLVACPEGRDSSSSLDYIPGSPLAVRKQQQLTDSSVNHPPSPLLSHLYKSPPGSTNQLSDRSHLSNSPSPVLPSSPAKESENVTSPVPIETHEEEDELRSSASEASIVKQPFSPHRKELRKQAMSVDEGSSYISRTQSSPEPSIMQGEVLEELPEEGETKVEGLSREKESESTVKRLIRGEFFRRSKQSKKLQKIHKSNEAEQVQDTLVPHPIPRPIRPKSAKTRPKIDQDTFKFCSPEEYNSEMAQQSRPLHAVTVHRSASMQVSMTQVAAGGHTRSSSTQVTSKYNDKRMSRYNSDDALISPTRKAEQHPLSPVDERSTRSGSPVTPNHIASTSPQLLTSSQGVAVSGESESEEQTQEVEQLARTISMSYPELAIQDEPSWDKTIDRRLYKRLNKAERERQAILHELLQTEKHHFRALHVLKLIFRQNLIKHVSEDALLQMFPELDRLIEISDDFIKKLDAKKNGIMIDDFSDVLLEQFSGDSQEQMFEAFGAFCRHQLAATEIYRDHMKKKPFAKHMKDLYSLKECQRLTLPDYYTRVSQRLSKLLTLIQRLAKKTEALKLGHAPRVHKSLEQLQTLMSNIDQSVEDHKNRMQVIYIQNRLEITLPRSTKITNRKDIKCLNLAAQDRKLRKIGEAMWTHHGKQLYVQVVLVTDLLVLLTERDQKYHLASLQDLKPPVIRLYDLHVRLNAAVKAGVQLLLLEQGNQPEMFRLEFLTKKEAKVWESTLNTAIEECKEKGLKCEFFGEEKVLSGDEERRSEEKEGDSDQEEASAMSSRQHSFRSTYSSVSPSSRRIQRAKESIELATRLLNTSSQTTTVTADAGSAQRHQGAAVTNITRNVITRDSPKNRNRSQTIHQHGQRPKTAYFTNDEDEKSATMSQVGEHVISPPIPPSVQKPAKSTKSERRRAKLDRSSTFRGKEKDKEREKKADNAGGGDGAESYRIPEQRYIECVTGLKESLEEMIEASEVKDEEILKLRNETESLKETIRDLEDERTEDQQNTISPMISRLSPRSSPPQPRPHSIHIDLSEHEDTLARLAASGGPGVSGVPPTKSEFLIIMTNHNEVVNKPSSTNCQNVSIPEQEEMEATSESVAGDAET